jgi:hypothetical protein
MALIGACSVQSPAEFNAKSDAEQVADGVESSTEDSSATKASVPNNITGSFLTCYPFSVESNVLIQCDIDQTFFDSQENLSKDAKVDINVYSADDKSLYTESTELMSEAFSVTVPAAALVNVDVVYVALQFQETAGDEVLKSNEMKLPEVGLVEPPSDETKKLSCGDKGGVELFDSCLFYGALGQSCSNVCSDAQLVYSDKTKSEIGSVGTNAKCALALNALGVPNIAGANYLLMGSNGISNALLSASNLGCYFKPNEPLISGRYRNTTATTADASAGNSRRACLCE